MLTGTNSAQMRSYNTRVVLELIRRGGEVSRAEIARDAGLSLQAVSSIFARLEAAGWIVRHGRRATDRGQPPMVYSLDAERRGMVGVAMDLDGVASTAFDLAGREHGRIETPLENLDPASVRAAIVEHVRTHLDRAAEEGRTVVGAGVAIPGTPRPGNGDVRLLPHVPGWNDVPLQTLLREELPLPVHVANDAIAAALGESWYGRSVSDAHGAEPSDDDGATFYVFFAHGINGALLEGRRPYGGIWGIAGKFGHIPVVAEGLPCTACGGRGCVEAHASMIALYGELGLRPGPAATREVARRASAHDPAIERWTEAAGRHLGRGLLAVENLFDPTEIVFGGKLPASLLERLVAQAERSVAPRRMSIKTRHPRYRIAERSTHAAEIGAATLPLYLAFAPDIDLVATSGEEESVRIDTR